MIERKDPYQLLKDLNLEKSTKQNQGKLKIFFGYAAGVGKTYAMLTAAHESKTEGLDVVVGYVEPHQRPQTNALLAGLEIIPALSVHTRGVKTLEFDLDAALKRRPTIILLDELAHTNATGLRHKKRFQDVEELLDHGIDVYTTVNVQHIESLNDKVSSITHIIVNERIPDKVFDNADQVKVIDIEVDELIERLKKGQIYQKEKVNTALENFFDRNNLIALREIALRRTADRINQKVDSSKSYISGEHILVCISASPTSARVIRAAARMANAFHAQLTALFVEGSNIMDENESFKSNLRSNFRLAQSFGAEIAIVNGNDLPTQIIEFARISSVSKIIVGRTKRKSTVLGYQLGFVDKLLTLAPEIEIYVIPDAQINKQSKSKKFQLQTQTVFLMCLLLILSTLLAFMISWMTVNNASVVLCYVIGSIFLASHSHVKIYAFIYAILSVLLFNYFFIEPKYVFEINEKSYFFTFLLLICVTQFIYCSTSINKKRAKTAVKEAYFAKSLLRMSRIIQIERRDEFIKQAVSFFGHTFKMPVAYYEKGKDKMILYTENERDFPFDSREDAVIKWVFANKKRAGRSTDTLPASKALYIPIYDQKKVLGCIALAGDENQLNDLNEAVLIAMMDQFALRNSKDIS